MAPLRASLAASRPPPRAAPRRRGVPPPGPPGLRPLWPPGHGPRLVPTTGRQGEAAQAEGRRAVWLLGEISKKWAVRMHGGGFRGACPPVQWSGGQRVCGRWAVRGQRAALSPPSTGRSVVHGGTGHRALSKN